MRLKDIAYINRHALPETTDPDYSFRYIDISAFDNRGNFSIPDYVTRFKMAPSRARRVAPAGSTVVSTVRTYLRAIARVPHTDELLVFSTGFAVLEGRPDVDNRFLTYTCQSEWFIDEVVARSVGVSYPAINPRDLGCIPVRLPRLDEQRHIADFLDAEMAQMESLIAAQRQARAILLERRAANVFFAVTGSGIAERVSSKLAWVDTLPAVWRSIKLGHFARMGSGHTPSRSHPEWWENCTIPWITTGEVSQVRDDRREILTVTRERISEVGISNSAAELHPKGTVVLCRTASAGYSAVMGEDMATSQDFVTWACGPQLDPFYLLWCLRAMRSDLLGRLAMGSTHKTIYVPDLQALRIPLPSRADQSRIVTDIRASNAIIDAAIDSLDRQAALLAERRQALITVAVTGQIDATTAGGVAV
jgi:type I restriction enzyme, S subunit